MIKNTRTDISNAIHSAPPLQPKIYLACLASYSQGKEHGNWVNANQSIKALKQAAQRMLDASPAGIKAAGWIILKTEDFDPLRIDAFISGIISRLAAFLTQHGKLGAILMRYINDDLSLSNFKNAAFFFAEYGELGLAVLKHFNHPSNHALKEARELLKNSYYGAFKSKIDFVQAEFARVGVAPPKALADCYTIVDAWFKRFHFSLTVAGVVHVFDRPQTAITL